MKISLNKSQFDYSVQFAQIQNVQSISKLSLKHEIQSFQSQNLPEIRSQGSYKMRKQLQNICYKRSLLQLMIIVKLQSYGYSQEELKGTIDHFMDDIQGIQSIQPKDLDFKATQISLHIITNLFPEENVKIPIIPNLKIELHPMQQQNQNQMSIVQRVHNEILCNICYNISSDYCEEECGHTFCLQCMRSYIKQNEKSGNYIVKCPQYDCAELITQTIIKMVLNPAQLKRFLHFKLKNQRQMNPNNKFCSQPDCGELLQRTIDKLKCNKCLSFYCQICLQNYHDDNPCDIVLKNAIEHTYKSFKIKKCPNCKSPIQKQSGCNHMTCKKCKFQFCWLCLNKYTNHHYRYYNCFGCPGMQFQDEGGFIMERVKQLVLFLMLPFIFSLIFFCYVSAIPIYIIGVFTYKPCYWIDSQQEFLQQKIVNLLCCCLGDFICRLLKWILFQPRSALYAVFVSPVKLTCMFFGEFCKVFQ